MRIQHNIMAMNAYRNYNNNTSALSKNLEKLSSGYKINRAGDDAAGLAISEKMRAQITGLEQAQDNAKSGKNLVRTAEGALQEVHDMLNRMVKLADQSGNGTFDNEIDRKALQDEIVELKDEIDRIADAANYNGIKLLDGSMKTGNMIDLDPTSFTATVNGATVTGGATGINLSGTFKVGDSVTINGVTYKFDTNADGTDGKTFKNLATLATAAQKNGVQLATANANAVTAKKIGKDLTLLIGDTSDSFNQLNVSIEDMHTEALKISDIDISTQTGALDAVNVIKAAINKVSSMRGTLGATQNRLDHTINNLSVMTENIQDAEATIRDTDVAEEMMAYTKNNILVQSAQAMLAQANQVPQGVLQLLQ